MTTADDRRAAREGGRLARTRRRGRSGPYAEGKQRVVAPVSALLSVLVAALAVTAWGPRAVAGEPVPAQFAPIAVPLVAPVAPGLAPGVDPAPAALPGSWSPAAAAERIDKALASLREAPLATIDDATFARRAYLDVVGRIPSFDELTEFLGDRAADKRDRLVDALIDSPGHRSHMANSWADLLRLKDELGRSLSGEPLKHWIRQSLEEDAPYDDMVRELLVAEGPAHAPGNGATGHLMRDAGMLEDSMANTVRAFLGARIECAQCHDHPYEPWTQEQYYAMVAFTGGMEHKLDLKDLAFGGPLIDLRSELVADRGRLAKGAFSRAMRPYTKGIEGSGTAEVAMPDDAAHRPGEPVRAATFTGEVLGPDPRGKGKKGRGKRVEVGSRESLADWVVGNDHGLFARAIANRTWERLMGRGVIEPLDDVWSAMPRHFGLMGELERLMLEVDYDLDAFQRAVLRTDAWRAPALGPDDDGAGLLAPARRRLSAEQVWDSLVTLVVPDVDATLQPALTEGAREVYADFGAAVDDPVAAVTERFEAQYLRLTDRATYQSVKRTTKAEAKQAERSAEAALKEQTQPLRKALRKAKKKGDDERVEGLAEELEAAGVVRVSRAERRGLTRASELPQPAPADHLMARFGQSDREQLDGGHREDSVPQVLALLNGFVERNILKDDQGVLMKALGETDDSHEVLERAWISVLGRGPTVTERGLWARDLHGERDAAIDDLVWCLVNSHEFLFTP